MFIDASAIVAIITYEDDRDVLLRRLDASKTPRYVAPTTVWESAMAIAAISAKLADEPLRAGHIQAARAAVAEFLQVADAKEIVVTADIGRKALDVAEQYGKRVRHPAQLNFGDCFAYACAKAYRVPLLYKGDDFSYTDLA